MSNNNDLEYYIGLSGYSFWKRVNGCYLQSVLFSNGLIRVIECNYEDKTMLVKSRHLHKSDWIDLDLNVLVRNDTIDINENGDRWEGNSLNGVPFGNGCYFNGNNILVYQGFVFEGNYVCYGEEFHSDTGEILYEGGYFNGYRFGYGKLYDKKHELLYEGDWNNNEPVESKCVTIEGTLNESMIYSRLEEICISGGCEYEYEYFNVSFMKELKKIKIGDDCKFENVSHVIIDGCSKLEEVIIGDSCFKLSLHYEDCDSDVTIGELNIMNCPVLSLVCIGSESFSNFKELTIESL